MGAVSIFKAQNCHDRPQVFLQSPYATGINFAAQSKVLRLPLTDITNVIDVASEQRCAVVVADAFVIVLGRQVFTKLLHFNPLQWFVFLAGIYIYIYSQHLPLVFVLYIYILNIHSQYLPLSFTNIDKAIVTTSAPCFYQHR